MGGYGRNTLESEQKEGTRQVAPSDALEKGACFEAGLIFDARRDRSDQILNVSLSLCKSSHDQGSILFIVKLSNIHSQLLFQIL